jgi:hypothetical protein
MLKHGLGYLSVLQNIPQITLLRTALRSVHKGQR